MALTARVLTASAVTVLAVTVLAVTVLAVTVLAPAGQAAAAASTGSGRLDPSFGTRGTVALPGGESLALGPGASIWVLGSVIYTDGTSRYLNRLTPDGAADPTFTAARQTARSPDLTTGPVAITPGGGAVFAVNRCCRTAKPPTSQAAVQAVARTGKGLAGAAGSASWSMSTLVTKPTADADYVIGGVVRLSDGRLRACVSVYPGAAGDPFAALVGLRADGAVDPTVGAKDASMPKPGWTRLPGLRDCGFASAGLQQLFVDGADRLYLAGTATGVGPAATRVLRTDASGVLDRRYGTAGRATIGSDTRSYTALTGVLDRNGTLWLGLRSRSTANGSNWVATVVKLTSGGTRDAGFGSHGVSRYFPRGGSSELNSIGTLPAGRLLLGLVYTSGGVRTGRLSAVSAGDGTRAVTFGDAGTIVSNTLTWDTTVQGSNLLTIGNVLPRDPNALLGSSVLQRRKL